jgi:integrase
MDVKAADARRDYKASRVMLREYEKLSDQYGRAISDTVAEGYALANRATLDALSPGERSEVERIGVPDFYASALDEIHAADLQCMLARIGAGLTEEELHDAQHLAGKATRRRRTLGKLGINTFAAPDDPNNPRLSKALEAWFAAKRQGHDAQKRHRVAVRRFIELHGDLHFRSITRPHFKEYITKLEDTADHRRIPASQRGGLADPGDDVPRISAPTIERHLTSMKALFNFGVSEGWATENVANALKAPPDKRPISERKRRNFTLEERHRLLDQAVNESGTDGDPAWLIRLAAYTGARLEELCQLQRKNVMRLDGVLCVEITDAGGKPIKNEGSWRTVPLHPAIAEDFYAWAQRAPDDDARIFSAFKPDKRGRFSHDVSGLMARLMDRAGLTDRRLVHHSWRHTLRRALSEALVDPDCRRAILGHAPKTPHDEYLPGLNLTTVAKELAKVPPLF